MGFFDKMREPVFLKESSGLKRQVEQLEAFLPTAPEVIRAEIEGEIKRLKIGIYGEEQIAFELKNSHMPLFVLHDLYLEQGELSAQIDFLIITRQRCFVIECKNLYGNIEINENGDFIRIVRDKQRFWREGIYSPITQNHRHLELLKQICLGAAENRLRQRAIERHFYDMYRGIVVLANPKTVLNMKTAPRDIQAQVIRVDQLLAYIRRANALPGQGRNAMSDKEMEQLARYYYERNKEPVGDYTQKYLDKIAESNGTQAHPQPDEAPIEQEATPHILCPRCGAPMVLRRAVKGENAGKEFWGCSRFPKCRGIVNLQRP